MLQHEIQAFATIAGQIDALIHAENHYLENHRFQEAVKLLPEKTRLSREYQKVCRVLSENPYFSTLEKEKREQIREVARNLQEKMHDNQSIIEMAMSYTDNVMQVFIKTHQELSHKNIYDRYGKTNGSQYLGIGQQV